MKPPVGIRIMFVVLVLLSSSAALAAAPFAQKASQPIIAKFWPST